MKLYGRYHQYRLHFPSIAHRVVFEILLEYQTRLEIRAYANLDQRLFQTTFKIKIFHKGKMLARVLLQATPNQIERFALKINACYSLLYSEDSEEIIHMSAP